MKELRDLGTVYGFRIINRVEHQDGRVFGYYKLIWDRPRPIGFSFAAAAPMPAPTITSGETLPLFTGPTPEQWRDPEEGGLR